MNAAHRSMLVLILAVELAACGAGQEAAEQPPPVADTALGDMVGTMDKARAVEATTMQHKEDLDRAMEAAEGQR